MGFFVDFFTGLFAGTFEQTEDSTLVLVNPVVQVFHTVFLLGFDIFLVSLYDVFNGCVNVSVDIHIQWHCTTTTTPEVINHEGLHSGSSID